MSPRTKSSWGDLFFPFRSSMRRPWWTLLLAIVGLPILSLLTFVIATAVQQFLESLKPGFNDTQGHQPWGYNSVSICAESSTSSDHRGYKQHIHCLCSRISNQLEHLRFAKTGLQQQLYLHTRAIETLSVLARIDCDVRYPSFCLTAFPVLNETLNRWKREQRIYGTGYKVHLPGLKMPSSCLFLLFCLL